MSKCVIVGGTRVCSGSPYYRVNRQPAKIPFPRLTAAERRRRMLARQAINDLRAYHPAQRKLARDLLDVVLAVDWNNAKTENAPNILESVKLLLVDQLRNMHGRFTLISY
jgi:hypothetical protein